ATDPCLSIEPPDGHCQGLAAHLRPHARNSFFRVVTSELSEPAAAADLIYRSLGKRRAAVVHGASALSQGLATAFALRFTRDGGKIVDQLTADVLYDTETDVAAAAKQRQQLVTTTPGAILAGTDALASDQFAKAAGSAARGCYYTLVGPYPQQTKSAAGFVRQYRQRFGRDASSTSLAAFDATGVLIAAIAGAIDDAGGGLPSRAQVLDALARTSAYSGAMGTFGFDARGDVTLKWVSAYQWLAPTDPVGRFAAEVAAP
ncbi:MAG TPA: ABC transporter substrate-binding protein, partial [Candidatus Dormibacteraeota bacterium]|nr:ABC transporter substrate-binding protein [Candidatus Dormibacteraeota bacterium]